MNAAGIEQALTLIAHGEYGFPRIMRISLGDVKSDLGRPPIAFSSQGRVLATIKPAVTAPIERTRSIDQSNHEIDVPGLYGTIYWADSMSPESRCTITFRWRKTPKWSFGGSYLCSHSSL